MHRDITQRVAAASKSTLELPSNMSKTSIAIIYIYIYIYIYSSSYYSVCLWAHVLTLSGFATVLSFVVELDELLQAKIMARVLGQRTYSSQHGAPGHGGKKLGQT